MSPVDKDKALSIAENEYNVFFGRGYTLNKMRSRSKFRELVEQHFQAYSCCPDVASKHRYVKCYIIDFVTTNKGAFFTWCKRSSSWVERTEFVFLFKKISQALRDRKKLATIPMPVVPVQDIGKTATGDGSGSEAAIGASEQTDVPVAQIQFVDTQRREGGTSASVTPPPMDRWPSTFSLFGAGDGDVPIPALVNTEVGGNQDAQVPVSSLVGILQASEVKLAVLKMALLSGTSLNGDSREEVLQGFHTLEASLDNIARFLGAEV